MNIAKTVAVAMLAPLAAFAADASVGVDFASAYVFRGVTFNDGLVAQPYADVSGLPIDFGVWANLDLSDHDGALEEGQFSEVDLYASYSLPIEGPVGLSIGYTEYLYPGAGGDPEPNDEGDIVATQGEADRELSLSAGLDTVLAPSLTVYYGLDGAIESGIYVELAVEAGMDLSEAASLSIGATLGYYSPDEGEEGLNDGSVSAGISYALSESAEIAASVTYVAQLDDEVLSDEDYDTEIFGVVGVSYGF